jgi:glycosyltransferase involved in cell wall biosynthesis
VPAIGRVLYIEHRAEIGGGQVSLVELLARLDRTRFEPVVTCVDRGELYRRIRALGIEVEVLDIRRVTTGSPFSTIAAVRNLSMLARRQRIDLIHVNSEKALLFSIASVGLRRFPVIWHCRVRSDFGWVFDLVSAARARMIIANSEYVSSRFRRIPTARGKVRIIHNGIDTIAFRPGLDGSAVREEFGIGPDETLIGAAGRLEEEKGMQHFVRAAAEAGREIPGSRFIVVGGPQPGNETYARRLAGMARDAGLSPGIVFTGFRSDMAECLAAMDIVVVPSLKEGFGRVVGEAMASGKPVICSRVGGIPELVSDGETGVLFPPGDAAAIAREMTTLAADRQRARELGRAARQRIERDFSMDRHVQLIENVYEEMLGE